MAAAFVMKASLAVIIFISGGLFLEAPSLPLDKTCCPVLGWVLFSLQGWQGGTSQGGSSFSIKKKNNLEIILRGCFINS